MVKTSTVDYKHLFEALPGRHIAMLPDDPDFTIVAETRSHAEVALVKEGEIIGKPFFEAFPDTTDEYKESGVSTIAESFRTVLRTRKPDTMPLLRYDITGPDGKLQARYWQATHYPLLDDKGKVTLIYQDTRDVTEEIRATDKLAAVQKQLDEALSIGLIGTWSWDIKTDKIYTDKNLARMFGVPAEEAGEGLSLQVFTDSICPEDQQRVQAEIAAAIASKGTFQSEYQTISRDGTLRWVLARGRIEVDEHDEAMIFPGVIVDITDRKHAEQLLLESRKSFEDLANSMPQLVWVTDSKGMHEYYNQRWYDFTGTTLEDTKGTGWNKVFHPDDQKQSWDAWQHSMKTGDPYQVEYRLKEAATGEWRWFLGRALPVRSKKGTIVKWYGTCTDIDEQKRASDIQTFLADATKTFGASLDYRDTLATIAKLAVPQIADWCSIQLLDSDGVLQQVAVAHKDPAKVRWAIELRKKQGPPDLNEPNGVAEVLRTGNSEFYPYIPDELIDATPDEEQRKLIRELGLKSVIVAPLKISGKTTGALTLIMADQDRHYTERDLAVVNELADRASLAMTNSSLYEDVQRELATRTKLEEQLREANEVLEERVAERTAALEETNLNLQRSNQELQDFAYVASHDLQEPLRKIQAFGNLLESEYAEQLGEGRDYLTRMKNAAARMSALIEDILSFSRVTTKARSFTPVDLQTVAEEVIGDLEIRIKDTNATINIDKLPTIHADPMQMRQLLQNLIANAIKFHRENVAPVISVRSSTETGEDGKMKFCRLEIQDNGLGFDEKYLDRIFAVFQRLHNRDSYEGTGIGLAVCRKIVERHGGCITATSKPNKGSTFIILLPMRHKKGEHLK